MTPFLPIMSAAIDSVAETARTALAHPAGVAEAREPTGASFDQVLQQFAAHAIDALKAGEAAALAGVQDNIPVHKVVDAVLTAERELQTAIALRDKAVNAYQEISRMAI